MENNYNIYIICGHIKAGPTIERFNLENGHSETVVTLIPRNKWLGCAYIKKTFFLVADCDLFKLYKYISNKKQWIDCGLMSWERQGSAVIELNNEIYVCGGKSKCSKYYNIVECYNPELDEWRQVAPMIEGRVFPSAAVMNQQIYVFGGCGKNTCSLSSCERYTPETNTWERITPIPIRCYSSGAVACQESIFVIGGSDDNGDELNTVFKYNPQSQTWKSCASVPFTVWDLSVCAINQYIFIIGGYADGEPMESTYVFDTISETWTPWHSLPFTSSFPAKCLTISR